MRPGNEFLISDKQASIARSQEASKQDSTCVVSIDCFDYLASLLASQQTPEGARCATTLAVREKKTGSHESSPARVQRGVPLSWYCYSYEYEYTHLA